MNRWLTVFAMILALLGSTACSTVEGFGKDLGKLGDKIEQSADKRK